MGWNDRLPEDPYWPDVSQQDDRDSYEQWLAYIEGQLDEVNADLSSQNIMPEDLRRLTGIQSLITERPNGEEDFVSQDQEKDQDQETEHTRN